ncbi:MAG: DNA polymerase IV [Chloroflexi bacterium]|nr:DNA polymerase IV [Chloroflexota bacterium]
MFCSSATRWPRRVLHIDLDAFFVSVEQARDASLRGKPVVVGGDLDSRGVVACASYEARPYGLRAGMPVAQARRLCPQAIFLKGDFNRYQEVSRHFQSFLAEVSPLVEPLGLDEAFVDLTGTELLWGPARGVGEALRERVRQELHITASVGIASGKVVAKVASESCKPDGLLEVPLGEERSFLAPLPVGDLPWVGPTTESVLHGLGVVTVGELANLPVHLLRRVFGVSGEALHAFANGQDDRPVTPPAPQKSISRETTLPKDTRDRDLLRGTLHYLAERAGGELREQGRLARQVHIKLRWADFETVGRQATLPHPTETDEEVYAVGLALMEQLLAQSHKMVRLIGIGVGGLVEGGPQLSLLARLPQAGHDLQRAIDAVRARYGYLGLQRGVTLPLDGVFPQEHGHYLLETPALSR